MHKKATPINKVIQKYISIYFWIGVNIIGIPQHHIHTLALSKKITSKW
jgi:hypothetical protein